MIPPCPGGRASRDGDKKPVNDGYAVTRSRTRLRWPLLRSSGSSHRRHSESTAFLISLKASRRADVHRDELRQPGDCASCTRPRESNLNTSSPVKAVVVAARQQEAAGARVAICADHAESVEGPRTRPSRLFLTVPGVIMSRSKSRRELQTCVSLATAVPALRNRWYQAVHSSDGQAGTGACEA